MEIESKPESEVGSLKFMVCHDGSQASLDALNAV